MLVLIPVFWMLLAFGPARPIDNGSAGTQFRDSSSSVPMTGKPIKIPPKKVWLAILDRGRCSSKKHPCTFRCHSLENSGQTYS